MLRVQSLNLRFKSEDGFFFCYLMFTIAIITLCDIISLNVESIKRVLPKVV